ncbi:MAG: hypothetical protein QOH93_1226 [Chloroflexia bacterium]|jgi:predicted RNA-binding Zn-ribbon protein involved in translation (DUF1610 family)|nr:hypothetical protein [Chloroflexia bacterium]
MESEGKVIVCMRVADALDVVAGVVQVICAECGTRCWRAPSSMRLPDPTICTRCFARRIEGMSAKERKHLEIGLARGAIREIREYLARRN